MKGEVVNVVYVRQVGTYLRPYLYLRNMTEIHDDSLGVRYVEGESIDDKLSKDNIYEHHWADIVRNNRYTSERQFYVLKYDPKCKNQKMLNGSKD